MIRRILDLLRCHRCREIDARQDGALAGFLGSQSHLQAVSLDMINESLRPPVQPYTTDQLDDAVIDAVKRAHDRKATRNRRLADPVEELATGALVATRAVR